MKYVIVFDIISQPWNSQADKNIHKKILQVYVESYLPNSLQKLWHFHKNIRLWVENECCYLYTVDIENVNFTSENIYTARASFPKYEIGNVWSR